MLFRTVLRNLSLKKIRHLTSGLSSFAEAKQATAGSSQGDNIKIDNAHIISSPIMGLKIPEITLDDYVWANVSKWPNNIAMECAISGRKYTYGQCRLITNRVASAFIKMGLKKSSTIALVLPNLPEFPLAYLGAVKAGLIVTLVNPQYTANEITSQILDSEAKSVVTISLFVPLIKEVKKKCPNLESIIVIGEGGEEDCINFKDMIMDDGSKCPENPIVNIKSDIVSLPYSSGTTGAPKGVMLSHYNLVSNVEACIVKPDWCNFGETTRDFQETFVVVLPFFHIYSLNAILLGGLALGAKIVTLPKFEPATYIKALNDHRPTFLHCVPPLMGFISSYPEMKPKYFERTHNLVSGGSPAGKKLIENCLERIGPDCKYNEGFGMTETSPVITLYNSIYQGKNNLGSCGYPIPNTQVAIINTETGESIGQPGEVGELLCKGPQLMLGYWKNEEGTREIMYSGENGDWWLKTGDIAYFDEQNNFYVVDRIKELIKVKGYQVAPFELENILRTHPNVLDCAVIGVPDDLAGELPKAFIVVRDPKSPISEEEICNYLAKKVVPFKQLKGGVQFIESIPRNLSGKILRKDLKNLGK